MEPLTPDHVQSVLDGFELGLQAIQYEESTATSELAAAAIGCEVAQIAKSMCFIIQEQAVLVVASGDQTVDDRKLAALFDVGRKKVKMAKPDQCLEIFGYAPGGVPPVAHRTSDIVIYLDETLQQFPRVYAAAGSANINFGLTPDELATITGGTWADVIKE